MSILSLIFPILRLFSTYFILSLSYSHYFLVNLHTHLRLFLGYFKAILKLIYKSFYYADLDYFFCYFLFQNNRFKIDKKIAFK